MYLGQHLGGQAHHAGGFCHAAAEPRVEIHAVVHRHVAHMFDAANQADVRVADHNGARCIVQRLHGGAA
ncbi:hypothetical protein D3C71_1779710 [compost metagenome]